jgi:mannose-6-phosphate isomerase-like protein (cupin superfamily)
MHIRHREEGNAVAPMPGGEIIDEMIGLAASAGRTDQQSLALIRIGPGENSTPHRHRHTWESYYILTGCAHMVIEGRSVELNPGDAILIEPPEVHQIFCRGTSILEFLAFCTPAWNAEDSYEVKAPVLT